MNYIGSKLKLSHWIKEQISKKISSGLKDKVFCDIFAGTGVVARVFKKDVKLIISNDIEYYAYVLNRNYIGNHDKLKEKLKVITYLDNLSQKKGGFIYKNYCSPANRLYFSDENGKKIDTIRSEIENYKKDEDLYYFLLASLLESCDRVANTASVYGAFLKKLKKTAQRKLVLKPAIYEEVENKHLVFQKDANELIREINGDILYLDPPYNHRQYGANYHLLNTIAKYQEFKPKGKSGVGEYYRSNYCKLHEAKRSFENLIRDANFKYIFLSYNDEGVLERETIGQIMSKYGTYSLIKRRYKRFKADKDKNRIFKRDEIYEYLHILEK